MLIDQRNDGTTVLIQPFQISINKRPIGIFDGLDNVAFKA
jgi:hypothetical protein